MDYSPWGHKELDIVILRHIHTHTHTHTQYTYYFTVWRKAILLVEARNSAEDMNILCTSHRTNVL